jgi:hypothetical protein
MVYVELNFMFAVLQVTETGCEVLTARLPSSPDVFPWLKPWCGYSSHKQQIASDPNTLGLHEFCCFFLSVSGHREISNFPSRYIHNCWTAAKTCLAELFLGVWIDFFSELYEAQGYSRWLDCGLILSRVIWGTRLLELCYNLFMPSHDSHTVISNSLSNVNLTDNLQSPWWPIE